MSERTGMNISQVTDEVLYTGLVEMQRFVEGGPTKCGMIVDGNCLQTEPEQKLFECTKFLLQAQFTKLAWKCCAMKKILKST